MLQQAKITILIKFCQVSLEIKKDGEPDMRGHGRPSFGLKMKDAKVGLLGIPVVLG